MSAERFLDDLARTLAQPMPRRRAIRVIGASLAAIAIPGVSPRKARAIAKTHAQTCGPGQLRCTNDLPERKFDFYCCEWPQVCGPVIGPGAGRCVTECPSPLLRNKKQKPCVSAKDRTKHACCMEPFSRCDPGHPDLCLPDCKLLVGPRATECGKNCCLPGQACKNGRCVACPPGEVACAPEDGGPSKCCCAGGRARCGSKCCPRGARCADPTRGHCEKCRSGTEECGSVCCKRGTYCCNSRKGVCCSDRNGSCCGDSPICCEERDCCQVGLSRLPICCPRGETCGAAANSAGLVAGRRTSICCTSDRVVQLSGATLCCPSGYRSLGGKLVVPPGGGGGLCCKASLTCGSGRSITCCGPQQTCQGGSCV